MARQYDVEDLLNSDASDPDGEPLAPATNDEVQEGKFPMETADGTAKIGNISQIVADYLKKSAGFYTEVRPYYIVRPGAGNAWTGTWQLFLHGLDDGGLSDATNITIGINGVVVHTAPWTASSGARDVEFSISETESTALTASSPTGSNVRCYVAFHDTEGNEIVIRHFTLKLLTAVPKIPEDEIPDSIARDDEVTAAIAAALAAHPGAFSDSIDLGTYENANGGAIDGHYVRISNTQVDISHRNIANEDKSQVINGIQAGYGLVFGEKIFVVEWTNQNAAHRSFNGFWAGDDPDTTAESSQISIKVITHELRMIRFITEAQLRKLLPTLKQVEDKTVDIHLQETPGEFANMNDATIAGLSLIQKTTEADRALAAGTYDFGALTWQPTSVDIPNDSNEYYVVARIAKAQGRIETQFRVTNNSDREPTEYLRGEIQDDANWRYYRVVGDYDNIWTLQRRPPTTHTRWDAPLGDVPLAQVQGLIPPAPTGQGLTPQQKAQFESLVAKTADLLIETRETWAAATDASFLALPADNAQLARVRSGNAPQGLTGWTTDITTTDARVILIRVPTAAQLADYRILLGDDNAVRLDTYGVNATDGTYAYMTSTSLILQEATRIRLQHHGNNTHTRYIGMLADALMSRLLPMLPDTGQRDNKVPRFDGDNLVWELLTGGGGITSEQIARLLPALPNAGDRNLKIAQFVNDVLTWKVIEGFVTEHDFEHRRNHTPNRVNTLPVRLEPQEQAILVSDGHWSDEYYRFALATHNVTISSEIHTYMGANTLAFSANLPVFGNTGLPSIFRANRVAAIYGRTHDGSDEFNLKIIIDKALVPLIPDPDDSNNMITDFNFRLGFKDSLGVINRTDPLTQTTFFSDEAGQSLSENEMTVGGKTYVALTPTIEGASETQTRAYRYTQFLDNLLSNNPNASADFHIFYTAPDGTVTYLSDDLTTPWADADEYPAGLYEGDVNGHPTRAALPDLATWNHVVARSNTYFSGTTPDAAAGVDGQFWVNLRTGQIHQKQSGTWTLITDVALQTEISRAIDWSTIPNNTQIPANFITKHANRYFGAKATHVKTSGSTAPTGDATNWIELSNEVTTGTSAVAVEWSSIPQNQSVPLGTIVKHGNYTYMCITVHNRRGNGPDSDAANWQLLTNYQGVWAQGYYHAGAITVRGTGLYLALHNVNNTDPAPDASTNVKWLQINNVEPPVRYIELTVNSGINVPAPNESATPLTYAASLAKSNQNTNFITRNTAGNAIDLVAGTYSIQTHIVIAITGNQNKRSTFAVEIYEGSNLLDSKEYLDYNRGQNAFSPQSFSSDHIFTISSAKTIQVRIKKRSQEGNITMSTSTGGTVTIKKE